MGGSTLVFQKVELVLKEIELHRAQSSAACGDGSSSSASASDDNGNGHSGDDGQGHTGGADNHADACETFETGPLLLDLPLGGTIERLVTVDVDTGTYSGAEFKIQAPANDAAGQAFLQAHPDLSQVTVRVTGTFNGTPFTYTGNVTAQQEQGLSPALVVSTAGATNLTLIVDVKNWFEASPNTLIDPATALAGGVNESAVRTRIRNSFHIFEDNDGNGHDDHSGNDH
ncbi:MAG: hypothetical protein ABI647_00725 [Gemmatimonadota bacterium]